MSNPIKVKIVCLFPLFMLILSGTAAGSEFGVCNASIRAEWLENGRDMELLEDYVYTDAQFKAWLAPKGSVVDGASIPQALWSFIGGPFEGLHRKASVTHDVECVDKKNEWRAVHRMFYDAMRCSSVSPSKAKIMYAAVYQCGPRWGTNQGVRLFPCNEGVLKSFVRRWKELIRDNHDIALSDLENISDKDLIARTTDPVGQLISSIGSLASISEAENAIRISIPLDADEVSSSRANQVADKIGASLRGYPGVTIEVEGHTDSSGSAEMNMGLSELRAGSVASRLKLKGISQSDIEIRSYGETKPISMGGSESEKQKNRRVEIILREELE